VAGGAFGIVGAAVAGTLGGLALTWAAVDSRIFESRMRYGAWQGDPRAGGVTADPYTRAGLARSGELPLGGGEGATYVARRDDAGRPLEAACVYRVAGPALPARWWTLTVTTPDGRLVETPTGRMGFTSRELVRAADGAFEIVVAPRLSSGNWLPAAPGGPFQLVLRLYDTPLASTATFTAPALPAVTAERCP
jgi:hypothetical protein